MKPILLALLVGVASAKYVALPAPFQDYCILQNKTQLYDPSKQFDFPWFDINLDLPPDQRWSVVSKTYAKEIQALIQVLINVITPIFPDALELVDIFGADLVNKIPQPYRDEIKSISRDTGVPLGQVVIYNIFYEIFTVCTSIVATDNNGNQYHARNLDFGLFMGWDPVLHEWPITMKLRKMIINVNWIQNGKVLFKSNNFAGYVGIYNGLRPKVPSNPNSGWTITANDRFMAQGGYVGLYRFFTGMDPNGKFMSWLARETLENVDNYKDALKYLENTPILAPVYYIVGGAKAFDGVIVARSLNGTDIRTPMSSTDPYGWYILETNYDQGKPVLYLDDRRTPGNHCMRYLGRKNVGYEGIFNVLSSRTTLNKLTAYSVIMQASTGRFETITQTCPGNCWPW